MSTERDAFAKAVGALRPYLQDLVVVGGWAHRLFRLRPHAPTMPFEPLVTDDADIATPLDIAKNRPSIDGLLAAAGFKEELRGHEVPPLARYVLETPDQSFELEFIAQRRGSEYKRGGRRDVTAAVAGVIAQKLLHVEVLLVDPWTVHLGESAGYAVPEGPADVLIPNAAAYLFQKLIVLPQRFVTGKSAKDVLYMFDTLYLLASSLHELRECWTALSRRLTHADRRRFAELRQSVFTATSDPVVGASAIARATGRPSPPTAETVAATCRAGFEVVFGP